MRLIDADKIDFNEVFGGQSDFAKIGMVKLRNNKQIEEGKGNISQWKRK